MTATLAWAQTRADVARVFSREITALGGSGYPPDVAERWRRLPLDAGIALTDVVRGEVHAARRGIGVRCRVREERDAGTGDAVEIAVRDTGVGIPAERIEVVFEPFVQVDRALNGPGEGTGLGPAIGRDLTRGMHGELTAASAVGVGSPFTLSLPAAWPAPSGCSPAGGSSHR